MPKRDTTLTVVGGALLSTCLVVGGIAAVSGNAPTRPAEVVGLEGVRGAAGIDTRLDKTKTIPEHDPPVASGDQGSPPAQPHPAPTNPSAPEPPLPDNGPVRVPPAAPTPTDVLGFGERATGAMERAAHAKLSLIRERERADSGAVGWWRSWKDRRHDRQVTPQPAPEPAPAHAPAEHREARWHGERGDSPWRGDDRRDRHGHGGHDSGGWRG